MGTTAAYYHQVRTAQFRRHAENARSPETREMYLRLAESEAAMAEAASRNQSSVVAAAQRTNRDTNGALGVGEKRGEESNPGAGGAEDDDGTTWGAGGD